MPRRRGAVDLQPLAFLERADREVEAPARGQENFGRRARPRQEPTVRADHLERSASDRETDKAGVRRVDDAPALDRSGRNLGSGSSAPFTRRTSPSRRPAWCSCSSPNGADLPVGIELQIVEDQDAFGVESRFAGVDARSAHRRGRARAARSRLCASGTRRFQRPGRRSGTERPAGLDRRLHGLGSVHVRRNAHAVPVNRSSPAQAVRQPDFDGQPPTSASISGPGTLAVVGERTDFRSERTATPPPVHRARPRRPFRDPRLERD